MHISVTLVDILRFWLDLKGGKRSLYPFPPAGLVHRPTNSFINQLVAYLLATCLRPDTASAPDLDHFNASCFDDCMLSCVEQLIHLRKRPGDLSAQLLEGGSLTPYIGVAGEGVVAHSLPLC